MKQRFLLILCFIVISFFTGCFSASNVTTQVILSEDATQGDALPDASDQENDEALLETTTDQNSESDSAKETELESGSELETEIPPSEVTTYLYVAENDGDLSVYTVSSTGGLTFVSKTERGGSISFLALHPNNSMLFATNQNTVEAFTFEINGSPTFQNTTEIAANGTHLEVDKTGDHIFVASYSGNQVAMLPLELNGLPQAPTVVLGDASDDSFCKNAHQIRVHHSNQWVYVPCLGSDHILVLEYDNQQGTLVSQTPVSTAAGAGPRHMEFHPTKEVAYVANELNNTVEVFKWLNGPLNLIQTVSTLPPQQSTVSHCSDVHVHPNGNFVYVINRDPADNIAIFSVADDADGTLTLLANESTHGNHARTFDIHQNGEWLIVGNSDSKDLASFAVDPATGLLTFHQLHTEFDARIFSVNFRYVEE